MAFSPWAKRVECEPSLLQELPPVIATFVDRRARDSDDMLGKEVLRVAGADRQLLQTVFSITIERGNTCLMRSFRRRLFNFEMMPESLLSNQLRCAEEVNSLC